MPQMPRDLPDDIWYEIAEIQESREDRTLRQLSLTSSRIRRVVVPVLFRCLSFSSIWPGRSDTAMVRLVRTYIRARSLYNSPHLVEHTRTFFFFFDIYCIDEMMHECLGLTRDPPRRQDVEKFVVAIHDSICRLLLRMPKLRELVLDDNAHMTNLLYAAICSRPRLILLIMQSVGSHIHATVVPPDVPWKPRLRKLTYGSAIHMDAYFKSILRQCILDLEYIHICFIYLPLVVSFIPPNSKLPLRTLSGAFPPGITSNEQNLMAFWELLRATPQLRRLEFPERIPDIDPAHYHPPPSLPDLSMIYGAPRLVEILSGGTNLTEIYIVGPFSFSAQPLTQIIQSSPMHLRELYIENAISQTPQALLTFIRSLDVFRNLELLWIDYHVDTKPWIEHVTAQDSYDTIKYLLTHLAHLQIINIYRGVNINPEDTEDVGCPVAKEGDPKDRGWHPTLEAIRVDFLCGKWLWSPKEGWIESQDWQRLDRSSPWVNLSLEM